VEVDVSRLKTLALSNDFGPIDASKPFQPFGALPLSGSALVIGSREVFQKKLDDLRVNLEWQTVPDTRFATSALTASFLSAGQWEDASISPTAIASTSIQFTDQLDRPVVDTPDVES